MGSVWCEDSAGHGPLSGLRVVDAATLFAAPLIATLLGDFGADVIKVEHPEAGDPLRRFGWSKEGTSLWWPLAGRNKRSLTLNFSRKEGQALLLEILRDADVLIENFRPGTLERWGLGYEVLHEVNRRLVVVRTSGFGQTGPYRQRPGFGTLAEAMCGFAHVNGAPDGPPLLPPMALADGIAALFGTFAVMFAIYERDVRRSGEGQVIDLSIYEPIFWLLGPQSTVFDQIGVVQGRTGNRTPFTAPRNVYRTSDDRWVALSGSTPAIAARVLRAVERPDLVDDPRFKDNVSRVENVEELDEVIQSWIGAHSLDEVMRRFEDTEAAIAPIYSVADFMRDAQVLARETVTTVNDPRLGAIKMPNVFPLLSRTPGGIRSTGPALGEHTREILVEGLGLSEERFARLREEGAV